MTRDEMKARAVELRGQGVYLAEIGKYLGVSTSTIVRWTDPSADERSKAKSREWKHANQARVQTYGRRRREDLKTPCPWCAVLCTSDEACADCRHACAVARQTVVEGMWADGWTLPEISEILGVNARFQQGRWREDGWDLPYRYQGTKRQMLAV